MTNTGPALHRTIVLPRTKAVVDRAEDGYSVAFSDNLIAHASDLSMLVDALLDVGEEEIADELLDPTWMSSWAFESIHGDVYGMHGYGIDIPQATHPVLDADTDQEWLTRLFLSKSHD